MTSTKQLFSQSFDNFFTSFSNKQFLEILRKLKLEISPSSSQGAFYILKETTNILFLLADLGSDSISSQSSLPIFKNAINSLIETIIKPLLDDINSPEEEFKDFKAQIVAKWWVNYLSLLAEIYDLKKNEKLWGDEKDKWLPKEECNILEQSLNDLNEYNHWRILLLRACWVKKEIFPHILQEKEEFHCESFRKHLISRLRMEQEKAVLSKEKNLKNEFRRQNLDILLEIMQKTAQSSLYNSIINGRFCKKDFPSLPHTVIFADDGGFFSLLNTLTENEKAMVLEDNEISQEYLSGCSNDIPDKKHKILIGKGAFGKIRLAMTLTENHTSNLLTPEKIICLKKTAYVNKKNLKAKTETMLNEIRENTWNDYSVGEFSNLIFSPTVYDMKIIEPHSCVPQTHQKGYTMMKFVPVFDGKKVFKEGGKYFNNWHHQKIYLISLFDINSRLLDKGICMSDLKPENTLYDGENARGMLIDLAGVVRKANRKELQSCKIKYVKEYTILYTAPELQNNDNGEEEVDLCKCTAFSLGRIIENVVLKSMNNLENIKAIKDIANSLISPSPKERMSVETGLKQLILIKDESSIEKMDYEKLVKFLYQETTQNYEKFGLNPKIPKIEENFIGLKVALNDPDKCNISNKDFEDLKFSLDKFFSQPFDEMFQKVYVLFGSSGSGKSTILQLEYLNDLKTWKINKPIPFYINLAVEDNLKVRWDWLNETLKIEPKLNFNVFSRTGGYPITLYVDSFDEVPNKINYVEKFLEDLGKNPNTKCLICCRSEFIKNDQEVVKWFGSLIQKRYIAPLGVSEFDLEKYIAKYYREQKEIDSDVIIKKIEEENIKSILITSYMVYLTLEVMPELMKLKEKKITQLGIYHQYSRLKIEKVGLDLKQIIKQKFKLSNEGEDFIRFMEEKAEMLAGILHKINGSKLVYIPFENKKQLAHPFFDQLHYDPNNPCLDNIYLIGLIRALNLTLEIKGNVPKEQITIGFFHDTMKNYFLVRAIIIESIPRPKSNKEEGPLILGHKLIIDDTILMKPLIEAVKEQIDFRENLMKIVFASRSEAGNPNKKKKTNAAANAISILICANVSFAGQDLRNIRICGANIRDGAFSGSDFTDADLTGVTLEKCHLDNALFCRTILKDIKLGLYPEIEVGAYVSSCSFSPDGDFILTNSAKDVKLFHRLSGNLLKTFKGHKGPVISVVFSPDGRQILSCAAEDIAVRLWDVTTGLLLKLMEGHAKPLTVVAFSPNGNLMTSGSEDGTIILWQRLTGSLVIRIEGTNQDVTCFSFSPDGTELLSSDYGGMLKIWEIPSGNELGSLEITCGTTVRAIAYSPNGLTFLTSSFWGNIKLWDRKTLTIVLTFEKVSSVYSMAFSPNGALVVSNIRDSFIIFDASSGKTLSEINGHSGEVTCVSFSNDGSLIMSGSEDKTIRIWDSNSWNTPKIYEGHTDIVCSLAFSPDGTMVLTGCFDGSVKLWQTNNGNLLKTIKAHNTGSVNGLVFSRDGSFFVTGCFGKSIKTWDKFGNLLKDFKNVYCTVRWMEVSHDGSLLYVVDNEIQVWNCESGTQIDTLKENEINIVVVSPNGKSLLAGKSTGSVLLLKTSDYSLIKEFKDHKEGICSLAFSKDGTMFISSSVDKTIKLWDIGTKKLVKTFNGHSNTVDGVCFSPDGSLIASGSSDKTVKLWDRKSGSLLKTLIGHQANILDVAFSPDGNLLVSISEDKKIKFWKRASWDFCSGASSDVLKKIAPYVDIQAHKEKKKPIGCSWIRNKYRVANEVKGNFVCKSTFSHEVTPIDCTKMILIEPIGLNEGMKKLFKREKAIII